MRLFTDNASGTLLSQVNPIDTTVTLNAGQGDNFPEPTGTDYAILTLENVTGDLELVKLTSRTGDTLTVERAQEGTPAGTFPASTSRCELRMTASALTAVLDDFAALQVAPW